MLTLQELAGGAQDFDHVLLEASGVASPHAIAATASLIPRYALDGIVVLADAETIEDTAADRYMSDTVRAQLADGDLILLNKADLVSQDLLERVTGWLGEMSGGACVVPATRADVPPGLVLGSSLARGQRAIEARHHPHDVARWEAETIDIPADCDPGDFARSLAEAGYARAKGFVADPAGQMWTVQVVGARAEVGPAPAGVEPGMVGIRLRIA